MGTNRDKQKDIADIALSALARGLCAVSMYDRRVSADVKTLGEGFTFSVCVGIGETSPGIKLRTENGRFTRADANLNAADVIIRFKDVSGAMPVFLGKTNAASAFAQHRMLVWGSVNRAVALVRIMNITQAYLFPRFMMKKTMDEVPKKQAPSLFVYAAMLFFGVPAVNKEIEETATQAPEPAAEKTAKPADEQAAAKGNGNRHKKKLSKKQKKKTASAEACGGEDEPVPDTEAARYTKEQPDFAQLHSVVEAETLGVEK